MVKESLYLSERQYAKESRELLLNNERYNKWCDILGKSRMKEVCRRNKEICNYLNDEEFVGEFQSVLKVKWHEDKKLEFLRDKFEESEKKRLFLPFYREWLRLGLAGLLEKVEKFEICTEQVYLDYLEILFIKLEGISLRVLIREIHVCKDAGELNGKNSVEEYQDYLEKFLGDCTYRERILNKYPVLQRSLYEAVEKTIENISSMIGRFLENQKEIQGQILNGKKINKICRIRGNIGDSHKGGQAVLELLLDDEIAIIYKPHSVRNEIIFQEWLEYFSSGLNCSFYDPKILEKDGYGWEEYVEYESCKEREEVSRYYERIGICSFLAHLFQTKDLHFENLIVHGEYPVFIDMEVLVGTRDKQFWERTINEMIQMIVQESVLNTGILPVYYWNVSDTGIDISAISNEEKKVLPIKIPAVINGFTSDIRVTYRYGEMNSTKNITRLKMEKVEVGDYVKEVVKGFSKAYQYAKSHKNEIKKRIAKQENLFSRCLMSDTQKYSMVLTGSYHPSLMIDAAERELYMHVLWKKEEGNLEQRQAILRCEIQDLIQGDIPCFEIRLRDRELYWHNQVIFENYLEESPLEGIFRKLEELCEEDRKRQIGFIEVSMDSVKTQRILDLSDENIDKEANSGKELILSLADKMIHTAIYDRQNHVNWINYILSSNRKKGWKMQDCGMYLYDGIAGVIVVLQMLLKAQKMPEIYQETFDMLIQQMMEYTKAMELGVKNPQSLNSGLYNGEASIVWMYLILYQLTSKTEYLLWAKRHGVILRKVAMQDTKHDLLEGRAGAILGFIYLYEASHEEQYLEWAKKTEKRLIEDAMIEETEITWKTSKIEHPLLGMAHGNAGISVAYGKLYEYAKDEEYAKKLEKVIRYEHNRYNEKTKDWYDYRNLDIAKDSIKIPAAWCHGAGGILLARLKLKQINLPDNIQKMVEEDIEKGIQRVKESYIKEEYCLCHGMCGNLMILEKYVELYPDDAVKEKITEGIKIVEQRLVKGRVSSLQEKYGVGLMNGYGGILCYFLRGNYLQT